MERLFRHRAGNWPQMNTAEIAGSRERKYSLDQPEVVHRPDEAHKPTRCHRRVGQELKHGILAGPPARLTSVKN